MGFYCPGTGPGGDLPAGKGFAERWHPPLLRLMPDIRLALLIEWYAQGQYLSSTRHDDKHGPQLQTIHSRTFPAHSSVTTKFSVAGKKSVVHSRCDSRVAHARPRCIRVVDPSIANSDLPKPALTREDLLQGLRLGVQSSRQLGSGSGVLRSIHRP